ncbi:aminotransferase class III-fold pyridoxal phosphate-dependent enzyme [Leisingera sp. NJS204]|uniref:aminotransferase class III-fold pyridoxal phosphate-dependent enzyme n=1 Tax=Leisingera sp. NJS204 TaxID=2508307 RepID=UPI0020C80E65|nr:aminotransferase class III-fold pyridoxal phosphate-dependent enzyme [Leisingera sp. NJS204]
MAAQMGRMPYTGDCHPLEVEWAEWLNRLFPSAERVRFTGSGTESTMLALRLGRAHSRRDKVLRIDGHFHGWHDMLLKGAKPGTNTAPSLGVPQAVCDLTVVAPPDLDAIAALLDSDTQIGTVFVEASGANYGSVPLPEGFLQDIRALADQSGHVLIFDEVITGLRWSPGGHQARDGLDTAAIRKTPPAIVKDLRDGLLERGVDFMSSTSCVTGLPLPRN